MAVNLMEGIIKCKVLSFQIMIFRFLLIARMASKETRRGVEEEDLANVEFETSEDVEVIPTFDSMALREDLLRCEPDTRD